MYSLREKREEDLVTYFQNFQNTSESSDDSTNVVNAPREPFVVKQDHSVNPPHIDECCCECGDALYGIFCQQCTLPCVSKPNFVDESSNTFNPHPQPPIYSCEFYERGAQYGHYCTPQVLFINPEHGYSQDFNFPQNIHDFQQQYLCCDQGPHETFQYQPTNEDYYHEQNSCYNSNSFGFDHCQPLQYTVNHPTFNAYNDLLSSQTTLMEQMTTLISMCEMIPACCDDDDDYNSAITPVLSTEEPVDSLSMGDKHLDIILEMKLDEKIKSSVEDLVPIPSEFKGIPNTMCDVHLVNNPTPLEAKDHFEIVINSKYDISSSDDDSLYNENIEYVEASPHHSEVLSLEAAEIVILEEEEIEDDNLREKLLNVHLLIVNIEALKDNPTPSSEFLTKSSSTSLKSFLKETNIFHNSLPEFESFCFDLEEISSGSTTTHSDISLPNYEAFSFFDDHIKEISSGSTTTHSDISLSEYDSNLPDPGELISILNSGSRENPSSTTRVNLPASPLIVSIRLSQVYLIDVELSKNSILTVVT
nr:hypothetical protein [Tanacetum cinerariifolium]